MMRRMILAAGLVSSLGACSQHDEPVAEAPAPPKVAHATGTVIGVDPKNGTITLQHGPIAELGWPAMRMAFKAPADVIASVKDGDRVTADLKVVGAAPEITAVHPAS